MAKRMPKYCLTSPRTNSCPLPGKDFYLVKQGAQESAQRSNELVSKMLTGKLKQVRDEIASGSPSTGKSAALNAYQAER